MSDFFPSFFVLFLNKKTYLRECWRNKDLGTLCFFLPMFKRSSIMAYNYGDFFLAHDSSQVLNSLELLGYVNIAWFYSACFFDFKRQLSFYQIYFRHGYKTGELSLNSRTANPFSSSSRVLIHSVPLRGKNKMQQGLYLLLAPLLMLVTTFQGKELPIFGRLLTIKTNSKTRRFDRASVIIKWMVK